MATIKLIPSTYTLSSTSYLSISNPSNLYTNCDSETYATVSNTRTATTNYYTYIKGFNFDAIPEGATINSFTVRVKIRETGGTTTANTTYGPVAVNNTTLISSSASGMSTSTQTLTVNTGNSTWEQIVAMGSNFGIRINCRRSNRNTTATFYIYGAEIEVDYTPSITHNITTSRTSKDIEVSPLGVTEVPEGTSFTVRISPTNQVTAAVDNGVDIFSQLERKQSKGYEVAIAPGATYGFTYNADSGYYEPTNKGQSKTSSVSRVTFNLKSEATVSLSYINYAEAQYDYGMIGNIDTSVATDGLTASSSSANPSDSTSNYMYRFNSSSDSTATVKTINITIPAGSHFIDFKYGKDDATDENNDSFVWKINSVTPESALDTEEYFLYTISNVVEDHAIVFSSRPLEYFSVNASTEDENITLDPNEEVQIVDGHSYSLNISPANLVETITDNGEDIRSQLIEHSPQPESNSVSAVLGTYSLISGGFNGQGATYFSGLTGKGYSASTSTTNYYSSGNNSQAVFQYAISLPEIPSNAEVTRVYMMATGKAESTSNASEYMCVQLKSGSTALTEQYNWKSSGSTTSSTQTLECATIPTKEQLQNLVVECTLGYYGGNIAGVTVFVEYTIPAEGDNWYTYEINSVTENHIILINNKPKAFIKLNDAVKRIKKVYQKNGDVWAEIAELNLVFLEGHKFQRGGQYVCGSIIVNLSQLELNEGENSTFTIKLDREPTESQIVRISTQNSALTLSESQVVFTPTDWNNEKTIVVNAAQDEDYENITATITLLTTGDLKTITVKVIDDDLPTAPEEDQPGATYGDVNSDTVVASVKEGESLTVNLSLSQAPTVRQIVTLAADKPEALSVSPSAVIFTPDNWQETKSIVLTALEDADSDNDIILVNITSNNGQSKTMNINIMDKDDTTEYSTEPVLPITVYNNRTVDSQYADFIQERWKKIPVATRQYLINKGANAVLVDPTQDSSVSVAGTQQDFSNNTAAFTYENTSYYPTKLSSLESSAVHEIGHILLNNLASNSYGSFYQYYNNQFKNAMSSEGPNAPFILDEGHEAMFNYHTSNLKEYFAEIFEYIIEKRIPISTWQKKAPISYQFVQDAIDMKYQ